MQVHNPVYSAVQSPVQNPGFVPTPNIGTGSAFQPMQELC